MNLEYRVQPRFEWCTGGESGNNQFEAVWSIDEHGAFNFDFPMRSVLRYITDAVEGQLVLPMYCEYEDFVDGELLLESHKVKIYFEHSLMLISFCATYRVVLSMLIDGANKVPSLSYPGYGVDPIC